MLLKMWDVNLAVCKLTSVEDNMIYCIIKTQKLDMILAITQVYTGLKNVQFCMGTETSRFSYLARFVFITWL